MLGSFTFQNEVILVDFDNADRMKVDGRITLEKDESIKKIRGKKKLKD